MNVINIGPDSIWNLEPISNRGYVQVITHYTQPPYEGHGELVGIHADYETLSIHNLSHCSCYGPLDNSQEPDASMSITEYITKYLNAEVEASRELANYLKIGKNILRKQVDIFTDAFYEEEKYTVEAHGPEGEFALYFGRNMARHGYNLAIISRTDERTNKLIEDALNYYREHHGK